MGFMAQANTRAGQLLVNVAVPVYLMRRDGADVIEAEREIEEKKDVRIHDARRKARPCSKTSAKVSGRKPKERSERPGTVTTLAKARGAAPGTVM
jgi:hypothetical protein